LLGTRTIDRRMCDEVQHLSKLFGKKVTRCSYGWRHNVVVSALARSTKLIDTAPGYYMDG